MVWVAMRVVGWTVVTPPVATAARKHLEGDRRVWALLTRDGPPFEPVL